MRTIHVVSVVVLCAAFAGGGVWVGSRIPAPPAPVAQDWETLVHAARPTAESGSLRAAALEALDTSEDPVALAEAIEVLGLVGVPRDAELLESFVRTRDVDLTGPAIRALGRLGTDEAVDVLIALLDQPTVDRWQAVESLGRSRNPRALPWLRKLLVDPELRESAANGLAEFGGEDAVAALAEVFDDAADVDLAGPAHALARLSATRPEAERLLHGVVAGPRTVRRMTVLAALAEIQDPLVFDALIVDLREAPGPIAAQAATSLGVLKDPRAIRPLRERALTGASDLRYAAMSALASIDTVESVDALLDVAETATPSVAAHAVQSVLRIDNPQTVDRLVSLAGSASPDVRNAIASRLLTWPWRLGEVPEPVLDFARDLLSDARPDLAASPIGLLLQHGTPEDWALIEQMILGHSPLRASAVWPLQNLAGPEAERLLRLLAEDPDPSVRQTALGVLLDRGQTELVERILLDQIQKNTLDYGSTESMLVRLGSDRAIDAVLDRIRRGTSREWSGAVSAIASGGSKDQIERMLQVADETDNPALRTQILSSLVYSDTVDLMAVVDRATRAGTPELEATATQALGRLGTPEARERLIDLAGAKEPGTRQAALNALAVLGGPEAETALIDALQDPDSAWAAVNGLQQVGSDAARDALVDAARGRSVPTAVRVSVLNQIAYMDGIDRTAILDEAIRDEDGAIRSNAIAALENVGTSEAAETLATVLGNRSASEEDRRQAAQALQRLGGHVADQNRAAIEGLTPGDTGR